MLEHAASDRVEHSVEELDGFGRGVAAGDLQRLVDHNGRGCVRAREHSATLNNNQPLGVVDVGSNPEIKLSSYRSSAL